MKEKPISTTSIQSAKIETTHIETTYSPPYDLNRVKHYKKIMQQTVIEETQVYTSTCTENGFDSQPNIAPTNKPKYSLIRKTFLVFPVLGFFITVYSNYPEIVTFLHQLRDLLQSFV